MNVKLVTSLLDMLQCTGQKYYENSRASFLIPFVFVPSRKQPFVTLQNWIFVNYKGFRQLDMTVFNSSVNAF